MNYLHASTRLPLAIPLRDRPNPVDVFRQLEGLPKRLWLDSSTGWPLERALPGDELVRGLSRYSYVTADPIAVLNASHADPNPWNELERLANWLPTEVNEELPGFQGGLAGLIGYESARWLNDLELEGSFEHQIEDLPTPAMSFGVYDWVICFDHFSGNAWLVCQGVSRDDVIADKLPSLSIRLRQAYRRAEQIQKLLEQPADRTSPPISFCAEARGYPTPIELLRSDFTSEAYQRAVAEVVERIHAGDSFQVNIAQRLSCRFEGPSDELYRRLRDANPAPFSAFYDGGEFQVLSSSPERFLSVADRVVQTRPIKGTTARTGNATRDGRLAEDLVRSEKDRAENTMIVDLMRNDLSRVCDDDSVLVKQLCHVERYQFVQHLVSVVEGKLRDEMSLVDLLRACFPGGSVTGAPKTEAMRTIAAMETHPRGPYCGSLGYIGCGGRADFNILIRTITASADRLCFQVGGGITARSQPQPEEAETWTKAEGMLRALAATNEFVTEQVKSPSDSAPNACRTARSTRERGRRSRSRWGTA